MNKIFNVSEYFGFIPKLILQRSPRIISLVFLDYTLYFNLPNFNKIYRDI